MADSPDLDATQPLPAPATAFSARFRLLAEIGRGGMGVVWRAEDTKLQREVALKFLPPAVVRDREAMAELAAETRRCLQLTHPHIVRVYDLVEDGEGAAISMELVAGGSLAARKLAQPDRCFSPDALARWVTQLCAALDYAHTKARLVHRDLKPLNLLLDRDDDLKVVDFGIARSLQGNLTLPAGGAASVSLGYAGPQQVLGAPAAVTDDIYALGATLYELLTGKPPFHEGDILTQLREVVPPSLAARRAALGITHREAIPAAWEETIAACLAKDPAARPQSAGEVAARLGLAPATATSFAPPVRRRHPRRIALLAAAVVLLGAGLWWGLRSRAPQSATSAVAAATPAAPEFAVTVAPPDIGARVWLAGHHNRPVSADGRLSLAGVPDGEHELAVEASGYTAAKLRVRVAGGTGSASVTLVPVFAVLQVSARPGTVVTAVNERGHSVTVGTVPASGVLLAERTLVVGTYLLEFAHPSCIDVRQPNTLLVASRPTRAAPKQVPRAGQLRVFSVPAGATVLVNGKSVGTTPATLADQPSEQALRVEVALAGHRRAQKTVTLAPGEAVSWDAGTLVAESGQVRLAFATAPPPGLTLRIDQQPTPHRDFLVEGLELGAHAVELLHPDYEPWQKSLVVRNATTTTETVALVPKKGRLTLAVTGPTAAELVVTLEGKPLRLVDGVATVESGVPLALAIGAKGYRTARHTVRLPPNGRQTLTATLEKVPLAEPGRPWTVPGLDLVMLPVEPGTFTMGTIVGEPPVVPLTPVTLSKPYWLGRTEVSQREWTALMDNNPAHFRGDALPVENISWADAVEFCRRLTERELAAERLPVGYIYALPTEAQWEHAWRAGRTDDQIAEVAGAVWHAGNSTAVTHPVGALAANPWGFHDLQGNVWEWCADRYHAKLGGEPIRDPKGPGGGTARVRRGGSYVLPAAAFRSAPRGSAEPDHRTFNLGFRLALVPKP